MSLFSAHQVYRPLFEKPTSEIELQEASEFHPFIRDCSH
jgi:hypothetical protein